jgi:hypothetical protein
VQGLIFNNHPFSLFFLDLETFFALPFGQVILHIGCAAYARLGFTILLAKQRVVSGKGKRDYSS